MSRASNTSNPPTPKASASQGRGFSSTSIQAPAPMTRVGRQSDGNSAGNSQRVVATAAIMPAMVKTPNWLRPGAPGAIIARQPSRVVAAQSRMVGHKPRRVSLTVSPA